MLRTSKGTNDMKNWFYYSFDLFKPIIYRFLLVVHIHVRLLKFFTISDQWETSNFCPIRWRAPFPSFRRCDFFSMLLMELLLVFLFPFETCEKERSLIAESDFIENDRQTDRFVNFQLYTGVSFLTKNLFIFYWNPVTTPLSWKSGTQ